MKKYLIGIVIIFLAFLLGLGIYFTKTDQGTAYVMQIITNKMPDVIEYDSFKGHLLGKLEINNLKLHLPQGLIKIDHVNTYNKFNLFTFNIHNDYLTANNIEIIPNATHYSKEKSRSSLPFGFTGKHIKLNNINLKLSQKDSIHVNALRLNLSLKSNKVAMNIYNNEEKLPSIRYRQNNHTLTLVINMALKKTFWNLHYFQKQNAFQVVGHITDNDNGNLSLEGKGEHENANIHVNANKFHLNDLFVDYWPSTLSLNFDVIKTPSSIQMALNNLTGTIHKQNITGNGHITIKDHNLDDLLVDLKANNSNITIKGYRHQQWLINWALNIPDLNLYLPNSSGKIIGKGNITGESSTPDIEGNFAVSNLHFLNYQVKDCLADFKVSQEQQNLVSFAQLAANNIKINHLLIRNILLTTQGSLKKHSIEVNANLPEQNAKFKVLGSYNNKRWIGRIISLALSDKKQHWQLLNPTDITYAQQKFTLSSLSLYNNANRLSLAGSYQKNKLLRGMLNADNLDLNILNFLLPEGQRLDGRINLQANTNLSNNTEQLNFSAKLMPGGFYYQSDNQQKSFIHHGGYVTAQLDKNKTLESNIKLLFPEGEAHSQFRIPNFKFGSAIKNKSISGEMTGQIAQLHFIEAMIPAIRNVSGKILANLKFTGSINKPIITGNFNLVQGTFKIPKLNLQATNVNIDAKSNGNDITLKGALISGNGTLSFNGDGKFNNGDLPLNLHLQGSNVLICNQPEIKILASPKLQVILGDKELKLSGTVLIPEAKLHPHDFGTTETASDDIIFIEADGKKVEKSNLKISSNITLELGNNIFLTYKGINGQILGQIRIEDDPKKATVAYGQLRLQDGTYSIYSKTLKIDYGKLNFTGGPISNPGLDIKASRTLQTTNKSLLAAPEQLKVGVNALGTLKEPKITLFSEPGGKSPSDILSYLLLGIPADSVTGTNSALLLNAASSISGGQGSKLLGFKEKLKNSLGLSELDIGTQSEIDPKTQESFQHTAFVLGKYLSPKFYVNYSLDLFDHTNTFKVRYLLNRFWTIQSVANTNNSGIDILYTVEK